MLVPSVVDSPLGAAMTVTPLSNVTGPGQPKLDSGSPQQAGFACQMLYESFWAATHLLLHNPSSLTSEQHWVTKTALQSACGNCRGRSEIVTSTVRETPV